jgi:hypothetical protein
MKISLLVSDNNIEHSLQLLIERQNLLEQLKEQFLSSDRSSGLSTDFTDLLIWIQQQDTIDSAKVMQLRDKSKQKSVDQAKIKKALHHYKNLT